MRFIGFIQLGHPRLNLLYPVAEMLTRLLNKAHPGTHLLGQLEATEFKWPVIWLDNEDNCWWTS